MIDRNILRIVVGRCKEAIPCVWRIEAIVQNYRRVGDVADLAISIAVELFGDFRIHLRNIESRLI
jgi:hypothetical protein